MYVSHICNVGEKESHFLWKGVLNTSYSGRGIMINRNRTGLVIAEP